MLQILNWKEGNWYFAVRCKFCETQFAFAHECETEGAIYFTDLCEMILTCPDCHYPAAYRGDQVERLQAQ